MIPPRLRRVRQCHSFGLHQVHFHGNNLLVTVTKRAVEVDEWVNEIHHNSGHVLHNLVLGLDIEWHPCSEGEHNPAATLQLCVGERCLIFLLLHKDYIPRSLLAFLAHPRFTFVGVGVQDDADKLLRDHGLAVRNVVDLRLAQIVYGSEEYRRMGLKKMAWRILGRVMEKPRELILHFLNEFMELSCGAGDFEYEDPQRQEAARKTVPTDKLEEKSLISLGRVRS
nr:Werner Syndrome-like exonuclease [Ipomoea batatas]GME11827.1 Werner Syndrome-like exonuclease [Ipomoea batatas]